PVIERQIVAEIRRVKSILLHIDSVHDEIIQRYSNFAFLLVICARQPAGLYSNWLVDGSDFCNEQLDSFAALLAIVYPLLVEVDRVFRVLIELVRPLLYPNLPHLLLYIETVDILFFSLPSVERTKEDGFHYSTLYINEVLV